MSNKGMNIQSYDGQDAFYSGTDEEYEEFLRRASENMNFDDEMINPEPVENTQKINLNETINLQNVIDKFKKTAGGIGQGAKAIKDSVAAKIDKLKEKKAEKENREEIPEEEEIQAEIETDDAPAFEDNSAIADTLTDPLASPLKQPEPTYGEMAAITGVTEQMGGVAAKVDSAGEAINSMSRKLDNLEKQLEALTNKISDTQNENDTSVQDMADEIKAIGMGIADVRQSVGSVSRLNDSVFDLKNTQLNTKNAVANLETAFIRLKKKCVLGITVMSILSAIIIALEILLMLS